MARTAVKKIEADTALLEAAKKVLRQNGYAGLSTRDVAAAAGVPLSQIHYHFGSKQGLVLALFEYLNAQLLDRQNALFGDTTLKLSRAMGSGVRLSRRRHRLGLRARPAGADRRELVRPGGREGHSRRHERLARTHNGARAQGGTRTRRLWDRLRGRGGRRARRPPPSWARKAFYLLGFEKTGVPVRQALRRVGDLIRLAEADSSEVMSCVPSCRARKVSSNARASRSTTRSTATARKRWCSCRHGASSIPASTRRSCPISASASAASPSIRAATANRTSRRRPRPTALDNYVADILAVMDATDAGKAILVGLSLGGMHACMLAAHHPERVKAAVLAGTAATVGPGYPYLDAEAFHGQARAVRGLGQVQPRLLAGALSRFRRALRAQHLLRSAFDQADRGRHRMGGRDHGRGAGQDGGGALDPADVRRQRGHVSQGQMPRADDPRRQRSDPALCARAGGGGADGRGAVHHPGRRAQSARALSGEVQRPDQ